MTKPLVTTKMLTAKTDIKYGSSTLTIRGIGVRRGLCSGVGRGVSLTLSILAISPDC